MTGRVLTPSSWSTFRETMSRASRGSKGIEEFTASNENTLSRIPSRMAPDIPISEYSIGPLTPLATRDGRRTASFSRGDSSISGRSSSAGKLYISFFFEISFIVFFFIGSSYSDCSTAPLNNETPNSKHVSKKERIEKILEQGRADRSKPSSEIGKILGIPNLR